FPEGRAFSFRRWKDRFDATAVIPAKAAQRPPSRDPLAGQSSGAARSSPWRMSGPLHEPTTRPRLLNGSRLSLRSAGMTAVGMRCSSGSPALAPPLFFHALQELVEDRFHVLLVVVAAPGARLEH